MTTTSSEQHAVPFWRDERYLQVLAQILVVAIIAGTLYYLANNLVTALAAQNIPIGFDFLRLTAGFDIGESSIAYSRASTNAQALLVGVLNTLRVSFLGIIFSTILGAIVGVARLSNNWLVNKLAGIYVEILRNIPLLVFLIFLYSAAFVKLPRITEALELPGPIYLTNRGFFVPWAEPGDGWSTYRWVLWVGLLVAIVVAWVLRRQGQRTGRMPLILLWAPLAFVVVALLGWFIVPGQPLVSSIPVLEGRNFTGGNGLTPEFMAVLLGLVVYTSAFIAEVVRAGIQAVSKGQREAATALGLSGFQTLRLVILPQAQRVIIPPLTSQYLNLTKNSSLAVAAGYPDVYAIGRTIQNQSGRSIEIIALMMIVYLAFSLGTSLFMNWYNKRIRLVER
ncbi:MAG: ABC transporter permease subunit [Caldilineales bacterium]|nr:ABC transporter permease subunit [Caldilineales bacterium]